MLRGDHQRKLKANVTLFSFTCRGKEKVWHILSRPESTLLSVHTFQLAPVINLNVVVGMARANILAVTQSLSKSTTSTIVGQIPESQSGMDLKNWLQWPCNSNIFAFCYVGGAYAREAEKRCLHILHLVTILNFSKLFIFLKNYVSG